jgi:hypothetical protein
VHSLTPIHNTHSLLILHYNKTESSDVTDVFKLIEHMEDIESSTLWIVRCITALLLLRKQLDKPFREAKKEEFSYLLVLFLSFFGTHHSHQLFCLLSLHYLFSFF